LLALAGYSGWSYFSNKNQGNKAAKAPSDPPIPVTVAEVKKANFPVYLNSLGTVAPYNTVTVKSRVDGQVLSVHFRQGQVVKESDILVEIDPRPYQAALDQASAKKAQDQANLKNAQLNLERYRSLTEKDFASKQQFDTQQALVDQLQAQIKGDQAAIDNAQTEVDYSTIRSPLAGRTGFRNVDPGNIVHASDTGGIVTIVKLQPISVIFTAPEEDVVRINKALAAGTVSMDALSSDGTRVLSHGHLALVNNEVDQASGTIRMKGTFANEDNVLWPGLSVTTRVLVDTLKDVIIVPVDAVQHGPNGLYAYVVGDGNKAELHDIKVDQEGSAGAVVTQGLSPGQKVVVAGQYRLVQGTPVQTSDAPLTGSGSVAQNTAHQAQ
jgi:multidrug efflux system membrane fusion protein